MASVDYILKILTLSFTKIVTVDFVTFFIECICLPFSFFYFFPEILATIRNTVKLALIEKFDDVTFIDFVTAVLE